MKQTLTLSKHLLLGKRNDIRDFLARAATTTDYDLANEFPDLWVKYHGAASRYRLLHNKQQWSDQTKQVHVVCGPTGSGKSHGCPKPPIAYWVPAPHNGGAVWFDGYEGETKIVIDEYYGWLPFSQLLRLCDKYPYILQTKGGSTFCQADEIFITSNKPPWEWYKKQFSNWNAFIRRVSSWTIKWSTEEHYTFASYEDFRTKWDHLSNKTRQSLSDIQCDDDFFNDNSWLLLYS